MPPTSVIQQLKASIARIEGSTVRHGVLSFGIPELDERLPGGGIAAGALHEVAGSPELADDASATIFLAGTSHGAKARWSGA